ncbi:MAG: glycosyltransferase family 8 protein [Thermoguttaceae bacterium]
MSSQYLHIAIASDHRYLVHAATLIQSIVENNHQHRLFFHLFTMDKRVTEDGMLKGFFGSLRTQSIQCEIHYIEENTPLIQAVPPGGTISNRSTFLRFLAADQLNVEKLLYLDCDMIVLGDLGPLFATPLEGYLFAAVSDLFGAAHVFSKGFGLRYFNAGMLLINVPLWKQNCCLEKSLQFTQGTFSELFSGKKHCGDQDVLNMLFQGQVVYVHPKYNAVNPLFLRRVDFRGTVFDEVCNSPVIVHFAGGAKPWNAHDFHPLTQEYWQYRQMTPWKSDFEDNKNRLLAKKVVYGLKRLKFSLQPVLCPFGDCIRRICGYPTRVIAAKDVELLMKLTLMRNG